MKKLFWLGLFACICAGMVVTVGCHIVGDCGDDKGATTAAITLNGSIKVPAVANPSVRASIAADDINV